MRLVRVRRQRGNHIELILLWLGGLNDDFQIGDLMIITDHISLPHLAGKGPLIGKNDETLVGALSFFFTKVKHGATLALIDKKTGTAISPHVKCVRQIIRQAW